MSRAAKLCLASQCSASLAYRGQGGAVFLTAGLASDGNLIVLGTLLGQHPTGHQIPPRGLLNPPEHPASLASAPGVAARLWKCSAVRLFPVNYTIPGMSTWLYVREACRSSYACSL